MVHTHCHLVVKGVPERATCEMEHLSHSFDMQCLHSCTKKILTRAFTAEMDVKQVNDGHPRKLKRTHKKKEAWDSGLA